MAEDWPILDPQRDAETFAFLHLKPAKQLIIGCWGTAGAGGERNALDARCKKRHQLPMQGIDTFHGVEQCRITAGGVVNLHLSSLTANAPGERRPTGTESRQRKKACAVGVRSSGLLGQGCRVKTCPHSSPTE